MTERSDLPLDVREFIERHLDTAAQADVLVLLNTERRGWIPFDVGRHLRIHADQAETLLAQLHASGLLLQEGAAYIWSPRSPDLGEVADRFCALYPTYRVAIISLIFSKPVESIRDFSDAFRLRSED